MWFDLIFFNLKLEEIIELSMFVYSEAIFLCRITGILISGLQKLGSLLM